MLCRAALVSLALALCDGYVVRPGHMRLTASASASVGGPSMDALRSKASELECALLEMERSAMQQIGATPTTAIAMSSDCNPLHDLSAVADYAAPFSHLSTDANQDQSPCRDASGL